jgi:hypothetical protein
MNQLYSIIYAVVASVLTTFVVYNFVPLDYLDIAAKKLGSTITTINATDTLRDSRAVINTNFTNLNTDKLESGSTASTLTIGTLTLTNDLGVTHGGTGLSTFGGTNRVLYTSSADTLSSEAAFTYDQSTNTLTADTAAFGTNLTIPQGLSVSATGRITVDDSSGQFRYYAGSEQRVLTGFYTTAFTFASTSQGTGTTTIRMAPAAGNVTFSTMLCDFDKHMGIAMFDGTNRTNHIIASSTVGTSTFSTNNTFSMGEPIRIEVGTTTGTSFQVSGGCRLFYKYEAD